MKKTPGNDTALAESAVANLAVALFAVFVLSLTGCQQKMVQQPSYRPLQASRFFDNGRSAQTPPEGTIARDVADFDSQAQLGQHSLEMQAALRAGRKLMVPLPGTTAGLPSETASGLADALTELAWHSGWPKYTDAFPVPITLALLQRGQERYDIYCSVCHDRAGHGHGMVVQRGFTPPPSYHTGSSRGFRLRGVDIKLSNAPVGYYFDVISKGFGAMPSYGDQVPESDRWAIIAYIRALQLSQRTALNDLPDAIQQTLLEKLP